MLRGNRDAANIVELRVERHLTPIVNQAAKITGPLPNPLYLSCTAVQRSGKPSWSLRTSLSPSTTPSSCYHQAGVLTYHWPVKEKSFIPSAIALLNSTKWTTQSAATSTPMSFCNPRATDNKVYLSIYLSKSIDSGVDSSHCWLSHYIERCWNVNTQYLRRRV